MWMKLIILLFLTVYILKIKSKYYKEEIKSTNYYPNSDKQIRVVYVYKNCKNKGRERQSFHETTYAKNTRTPYYIEDKKENPGLWYRVTMQSAPFMK